MSYTLLVVDYDGIIREQVAAQLASAYKVLEAESAEKALSLFQSQPIDLVVTDLALPTKTGLDLLKEVRAQSAIPVLFLSTRDSVEDQLQAYENGADDYIVKPCDLRVLTLKVARILERAYPDGVADSGVLTYEQLAVDKLARLVKVGEELIPFRPKEFDLLVFFMENPGQAMERNRILDAVWGVDFFGDTRVVDTHVKKIRKKIAPYSKLIQTVFGVGYKYEK